VISRESVADPKEPQRDQSPYFSGQAPSSRMKMRRSVWLATVVAALCYGTAHAEEPWGTARGEQPSLDDVPAWHWLEAGKSYLRIRPPDEVTAVRYFAKAVAAGEPWVLYDVAEVYRKGEQMQANHPEAVRLYSRIVEDGDRCASDQDTCAWAKYQLGEMLRKGEGAPQDIRRARRLLEDAVVATGDEWTKVALGELLDDSENPADWSRAADLYRQAVAEGNTYAQSNLRDMCERNLISSCGGEGVGVGVGVGGDGGGGGGGAGCERRSPGLILRQAPQGC
jgi:hypothetical protein